MHLVDINLPTFHEKQKNNTVQFRTLLAIFFHVPFFNITKFCNLRCV